MKSIDFIATHNMLSGLECHLLSVGEETVQMRKLIEGAAALLREAGYNVEAQIAQGQADTVITNKVASDNIDLLVMGAYGHSRIRNLIIGSTTTQMIRSCKVPVLLFR